MTEKRFNECLARFRNGDNEGFVEIYKEYSSKVYGTAMLITKNTVWAEEATSILFADLLKQAQKPKMYVKMPDSYIYRAAKNIATKVKFAEEFKKNELDENIEARESATEHIEFILDFERLMESFSERQREYAILHYVHSVKYKEIAAKFDVTENAVKQSFIYIKKRIKEYFSSL